MVIGGDLAFAVHSYYLDLKPVKNITMDPNPGFTTNQCTFFHYTGTLHILQHRFPCIVHWTPWTRKAFFTSPKELPLLYSELLRLQNEPRRVPVLSSLHLFRERFHGSRTRLHGFSVSIRVSEDELLHGWNTDDATLLHIEPPLLHGDPSWLEGEVPRFRVESSWLREWAPRLQNEPWQLKDEL